MITLDNLKKFFNTYILKNKRYTDYKFYNYFMEYVSDVYMKHFYNDIPYNLKLFTEDQSIPIDWYDNLLKSNGFPTELVESLTTKDKYIILSSLMDYNRLKGTVEQIFQVAYSFNEKINIYELFLDKRIKTVNSQKFKFIQDSEYVECLDENVFNQLKLYDFIYPSSLNKEDAKRIIQKEITDGKFLLKLEDKYEKESLNNVSINYERWYFIPYEIYIHPEMSDKKIKNIIEFQNIYQQINSFLLNEYQLDDALKNNKITIPYKTNLIFLDYGEYQDTNILNSFIGSIILKNYSDNKIPLYFEDGTYILSFKKVYKLWYYLLFKYHNEVFQSTIESNSTYLFFDPNNINLDYDMEEIDDILNDYNSIKTNVDADEFRNKYFSDLHQFKNTDINILPDNLQIFFSNELGEELLNYIDNRVNSKYSVNNELNFVLDEIYNSILTWSIINQDTELKKHIHFLLDSFTKFTTKINDFPSYKLLIFLKPYHIELVNEVSNYIRIRDNFNIVKPDSQLNINESTNLFSFITVSNQLFQNLIISYNDSLSLNNFYNLYFYKLLYSGINLENYITDIKIKINKEDVLNINDLFKSDIVINDIKSILVIVSENLQKINIHNTDTLYVLDELKKIEYELIHKENYEIEEIFYLYSKIKDIFNTLSIVDESVLKINHKNVDFINIIESYNINNKIYEENTINLNTYLDSLIHNVIFNTFSITDENILKINYKNIDSISIVESYNINNKIYEENAINLNTYLNSLLNDTVFYNSFLLLCSHLIKNNITLTDSNILTDNIIVNVWN